MIDYDAITYFGEESWDRAEKDMIMFLKEAMIDGEVTKCNINYEWEICDSCRGEGSHSKHLGAFTSYEVADWDDEEKERYFTGVYDQSCTKCNGTGKVKELNIDSMPDDVQQWIESYFKVVNDDIQCRMSEMRMGA